MKKSPSKKIETRKQFLAPPLANLLASQKQAAACIAGRGTGKSTYVGAEMYDCSQKMPRMLGGIWGLTYVQILTKILPSAKKQLMAMGLKHDRPGSPGHFVVGRKPPDHFRRPYTEPLKWENVLTLFNGAAWEFISADRPETIAGTSHDVQIFDEAVYFPKDIHDVKAVPSLRGNVQYFYKCRKHGIQRYVSSQAWDPSGYWVEDQKYLRDEDTGEIKQDDDGKNLLDPDFDFFNASSWSNEPVLTRKTLLKWKRTLPQVVYDIEVMAKRGEKISNAFYEKFNSHLHTYIRSYEYGFDYEKNEFGVFVKQKDADRDTKKPILLTFDFGTSFNSLVVAQEHDKPVRELRCMNEYFESNNQLLSHLVDPFIKDYENHSRKEIDLYGDPGGNKPGQMETLNLFQKITQRLQKAGWKVNNRMPGKAYPLHRTRHQFINGMLAEADPRLPIVRINMHKCRYLLTSIKNAPMTKGKKDKSAERDPKTPQETATHFSDAFDYLLFYRYYGNSSPTRSRARLGSKKM